MLLPSFYRSKDYERAWSVTHAASYGAVVGALAALFKTLGPLHANAGSGYFANHLVEIILVATAFAFLCAGAAALRNYIARRLVWNERR